MAEKQFPEPSNLERLLTSIEQAQEIRYASLQREAIRRAATQQLLIVTGGPGTGKTAVALHRAAYLLYTHRRKLERSGVLVIGPSTTFLRYIDQVLPSLGETGVVSRTIADLIPGIKATATDTPLAAKLKGDRRMAQVVANAIALRERVPQDLPTVHVNGFAVRMLDTDVRAAIDQAKRTRQPHNKARETFVRTMLMALRDRYAEQLDYTPSDDELNEALTSRFAVVQMPTITQDNLEKLLRAQFPDLTAKYVHQFALLFLDLQKKCDSAEISTKALDLRGMLDALRLIRRGIPAGAALDMGITNKAFDSYEQGLIRDVIAARIPAKLDAGKLFA